MKFTGENFTGTRMFVQSDRHVASYYAGTYPSPITRRPELDERIDADVLVVGAGFSGLHTALRIALAGKRVVVLEDTSTTGGSPLKAAEALEKVGALVVGVAVVVDRGTGAQQVIEAAGYPYFAAIGLTDLGLDPQ